MDFSSITEFPPLTARSPPGLDSQVMSPNETSAPPYGVWDSPIYAMTAGEPQHAGRTTDKRARESGDRAGVDEQPSPAPLEQMAGGRHCKVKLALRPLDTSKPEEYDAWRYAAKAELVGAGPDAEQVIGYIAAIEDVERVPDATLRVHIGQIPEKRALDTKLFSAVLSCLTGARRAAVEDRIRAQVPFAAGALALRCLDAYFHKSAESRMHAATRELMNL